MLKSLLSTFTHTQNAPACKVMKRRAIQYHQGVLTTIFSSVTFVDIAFKLERVIPFFSSFNSCPSLPS